MAKLPFLQTIEFKVKRYSPYYPKSFNHIGDHIKAKRLELGFNRFKASKAIGVELATVIHWEDKVNESVFTKNWPKIIHFLEYCPYQPCITLHEKVAMGRKLNGFSVKEFAGMIGIDEGTLSKFERGEKIYSYLSKKITSYVDTTFRCN